MAARSSLRHLAFSLIGGELPTEIEPDERRRLGVLTWITLGTIGIGIPFMFQYIWLGVAWMSVSVGGTILAGLWNIRVARRSLRPDRGGAIATALLFLLLVLSNVASGGFYDPNFAWFYVIPVLAAFLVDPRTGWVFTAIVLVTTLVFWALPEFGFELPDLIPPEDHAGQSLANRVSAVLAIGLLLAAIGSQRRFSERQLREANDDLRMARRTAEEASQAKSHFLATMSHEFRTPLNVLVGEADILIDSLPDEEPRQHARSVRRQGESLARLVAELLDLSRIEARKITLEPTAFSLRRTLEFLIDNFSVQAQARGLSLDFAVPSGVPDRLVGDVGRIEQVLNNFTQNALKYTTAGSIHVHAEVEEEGGPKVVILLSVSDTGIGIAPEDCETIFEAFERLEVNVMQKGEAGVGLGLAICRRLAEAMNGSVGVRSAPGEGSTFWFSVPLSLEAPAVQAPMV